MKYSPLAKLVADTVEKLIQDPRVTRTCLVDYKLKMKVIAYYGNKDENTILTILTPQ